MWNSVCTKFALSRRNLPATQMATNPTEAAESSGSHSRPTRLRRAFDTLGVKLFLAIAGANLVLVMAVYLGYSWSLDKGLVDYVNKSERARLNLVIDRLAAGYQEHGSWQWLEENRGEQWRSLVREELGGLRDVPNFNREQKGPQKDERPDGDRGAARDDRGTPWQYRSAPREQRGATQEQRVLRQDPSVAPLLTINWWNLMLFDGTRSPVIPERIDAATLQQAEQLPINVNGMTVGYIGYVPSLRLVQSMESTAAKLQSQKFVVIAIGMLAAVLLNATLISHWLARRLRALGHGATALARGDYSTRIPAQGNDELARLAGDFNHLAYALEAAQRGRQQWIADIAHELRTPLTSLRAEVEAVQDGVRPLTQASIASVAQEVHQLTRLVEDLRLLSLSDLGALTCRKEPAQLAEIIDDVLAIGRTAIAEKGLEVQVNVDGSILVEADADRLTQVFSNLLQNTLRYSESPARLAIQAVIDGAHARIEWEDTPPGVADADLHRLTERLYRADESRARNSGGSGLGLAIVKAIVDAHGGRMQAGHSTLGGLRWSIWLPLSES
jgi:two-component system, OmpR family, sensor histidine kinase BaeS